MNSERIIAALDLPSSSRVDQRVPKKLLVENGAATSADKRYINEGIQSLFWLAAFKPTTVGVPEFRDSVREYLEIALLRLTLRPGARMTRLVELVHRAVPYPVLLLTDRDGATEISTAHKRWSQGEAGKTVLDGEIVALDCGEKDHMEHMTEFLALLGLGRQPRTSMYALYQGWLETLLTLQAARLTGLFNPSPNPAHAAARQEALGECARLESEMARLRKAAAKEKQVSRQVELNLELKRMEAALATAKDRLR